MAEQSPIPGQPTTASGSSFPAGQSQPVEVPVPEQPIPQAQQPVQQVTAQPQPVQQAASVQAQAPQTSQTQAQDGASNWEERYKGLQRVFNQTAEELRKAQSLLQQQSRHSGALEQQLGTVQQQTTQLAEQQAQATQALQAAQVENQFWTLISTEFQQLLPIAGGLQRMPDVEQQRQLLMQVSQGLGNQVTNLAQAQVQQRFAGVTPGAAPATAQAAQQWPDKGELLRQMDEHHPSTPEYQRLKAIWDKHPENNHATLEPNWVDPMQSHWDLVRHMQDDTTRETIPQRAARGAFAPTAIPANPTGGS